MNQNITEEEYAALIILRSTGATAVESALLARKAVAKVRGSIKRARRCLELGEAELRRQDVLRHLALSLRKTISGLAGRYL